MEETVKWDDSKYEIMNIIDYLDNPKKIQIPLKCPICFTYNAHVYMHRFEHDKGTIWTWCSKCKSCMHGSRMKLPHWWENSEFIDVSELTSHPVFLDSKAILIDKHLRKLLGK